MPLEKLSSNKTFEGYLEKHKFQSASLGGLDTQFNIFIPPQAQGGKKVPVLYYLSGLTCTEDNAAQKGGFFRDAAAEGIALVFPDTSPRGAGIQGEDADWDFGTGAGFYVNATKEPWKKHYNMYDFVTKELPLVVGENFPVDTSKASIFGHSMGGHGALAIYLKEAGKYRSASAYSPIANPTECPWGKKAFNGYLQGGVEEGKQYDATELIKQTKGRKVDIMIDCGTGDNFYKQGQLLPEQFEKAAREAGHGEADVQVRLRDGYDHSYYFISTFAEAHIKFHAKFLKA